jgi:signal transduction histidine kinase
MSSVIAAPVGGHLRRTRASDAREHERKRLRRHLRVTALRSLETIATAGEQAGATDLVAQAGDAANGLRHYVRTLSEAAGNSPVAETRRHVGALMHDTTLQTLEYLACDGYGAELTAAEVRSIAAEAADELRRTLFRLGNESGGELVEGLRRLVAATRLRTELDIRLEADGAEGAVHGEDAAALLGAVREALNNVRKHARATHVVVRCEAFAAGARVTVQDDGVGLDPSRIGHGLGLRGSIFERMARCGGRADLTSEPGRGTLVTLTAGCAQEVAA